MPRSTVSRALDVGLPVLTAVRPPYTAGWADFHGGLAVELAPDLDAVLAWCRAAATMRRAAGDIAVTAAD